MKDNPTFAVPSKVRLQWTFQPKSQDFAWNFSKYGHCGLWAIGPSMWPGPNL